MSTHPPRRTSHRDRPPRRPRKFLSEAEMSAKFIKLSGAPVPESPNHHHGCKDPSRVFLTRVDGTRPFNLSPRTFTFKCPSCGANTTIVEDRRPNPITIPKDYFND